MDGLHEALDTIRCNPLSQQDRYTGPSLLIWGARSDFVEETDIEKMRVHFPKLEAEAMETGHNAHVEDRKGFLSIVQPWLQSSTNSA